MSARVESWAWQQKVGNPIRKMVLAKLGNAADDNGWSYWGQARIARECEVSRQTVNEHIAALRGMGLVQVVSRKRGGRVSTCVYRVVVPWALDSDPPPTVSARPTAHRVGEADSKSNSQKTFELERQNLAARGAAALVDLVEPLGKRRYRVPSKTTAGRRYTVDLGVGRCSCRASRVCAHRRAAEEWEERARTLRRKKFRDAIWDVLVELFGEVPERARGARGQAVADLVELLAGSGLARQPGLWQEEVRARYRALAADWGLGKTTLQAFVKNWHIAGKLRKGETVVAGTGEDLSMYRGRDRDEEDD